MYLKANLRTNTVILIDESERTELRQFKELRAGEVTKFARLQCVDGLESMHFASLVPDDNNIDFAEFLAQLRAEREAEDNPPPCAGCGNDLTLGFCECPPQIDGDDFYRDTPFPEPTSGGYTYVSEGGEYKLTGEPGAAYPGFPHPEQE